MKTLFFLIIVFVSISKLPAQNKSFYAGSDAPDFKLKELASGNYIELNKIGKDTVVILEFWATWCEPCVEAFDHLNKLQQTFANAPVKFISVGYQSEEKISTFLSTHELKTIVAIDEELNTWDNYLAWSIPMSVIIDKDRKVAGFTHPNKLNESVINDILDGKTLTLNKPGEQPYFYPGSTKDYFKKKD